MDHARKVMIITKVYNNQRNISEVYYSKDYKHKLKTVVIQ